MNAIEFLEKGQEALREARSIVKSPKCNNIIITENHRSIGGVFIHQLPEDQIDVFKHWLTGQTTMYFLNQPFAYATDYDRWYASWIKG